ncbi:unnamed protein product [Rotaria magnacalcarata]|uniref:EF-hand domain-containing protein n=5 Tax=Rotaria magnacalcarata TaxID=392030 RepID=A0A816BSZ4_9BILA|nr:unnamed protein product [Rotaria magnacalcarata]CAF1614428.1 unnamed protein product [Rotaria magnacalcarata]CAF1899445.1 unnamed protein product [Rotaria magnacalcarata]CAF1937865.1 unnamed protein product [Rotaria magnacalcarata]CAF2051168.1 unnamed protein product [Rotaria magnacalcarata]
MGHRYGKHTFTERDVQVLVKSSGKTENEIRQWYEEFRKESDGADRMNKRQFQSYYTKLKQNSKLEEITDHIFRVFDTDQSGTVDFAEFLIAYIATTTGPSRQKFEYAFELFDINENEKVERKEAEKMLSIICRIIGVSQEDAKLYTETIMLSFDTNQDKIITKEEFVTGCLHDTTLGEMVNAFNL